MGAFDTIVSLLAALSSLAIYLSPSPSMYRVIKERKTGEVSIIPLVSMLANCHMWCVRFGAFRMMFGAHPLTFLAVYRRGMYGYLVKNMFPLFTTMALGFTLALSYICVYLRFTTQPKRAMKILAVTFSFLLLVTAYVAIGALGLTNQSIDQVATVMGYIGSIVSFLLYSSPFEKIVQVLRTRSAKSIPIGLCVASAVGNSLWTVAGAVNFDLFVLVPNAVCAVPPMIQIVLYVVFRPRRHAVVLNYSVMHPVQPPQGKLAVH